MKYPVIFITAMLLFLIKYANNYMIRRKKKEFAVQTMMGMEQKTTAYLFFLETFIMGMIAIVCGILLGTFLSQIITVIILKSFGQTYTIYFSFFADSILSTVVFFLVVFCIIGAFNIKTIRKIKVIDMLNDGKKTEMDLKKDKGLMSFTGFATLAAIVMFISGLMNFRTVYDSRYDLSTKIAFYGNLVVPAVFFLISIYYALKTFRKKILKGYSYFMGFLSLTGIVASVLAMQMNRFLKPFSNDIVDVSIKNLYALLAVVFLLFSIFGFFYCVSDLIMLIKIKSRNIKYKNLFLFGQITAKLKTTSKTMAIIAITLMSSLIALVLAPILSNWSIGYLDERAVCDVQLFSMYNQVETFENLPKTDYNFVTDYIESNGYTMKDWVQTELYFLNQEDFLKRQKIAFPVLGISLSDYNHIRRIMGLESISLGDDSFTTQWHSIVTDKEIQEFLEQNSAINAESITLKQATFASYQDSLGETLYNSYTNVIYVLPDKACKNLTVANINFYGSTDQSLSYEFALQLQNYVQDYMKESDSKTGNSTDIRIKTLQINGGISGSLMTRLLLTYIGVVLIIICFTVLSLQQLSDSSEHRYRFSVLQKIGVEDTEVDRLILKQMVIWFGIPILTALVGSSIILNYFIKSSFKQLFSYVGVNVLITNIGVTCGVILIILLCYFTATWMMFKRNIHQGK